MIAVRRLLPILFLLSLWGATTVFSDALYAKEHCLPREALEILFAERAGYVSRYLPADTQSAFLEAPCVVREGKVYSAIFADGREAKIQWVGTQITGHLYQILSIERTAAPLIEGIQTDPVSPEAFRVRLKTDTMNAKEIEIWHFPAGFKLVKFIKSGHTWIYAARPHVEWAVKISGTAILYFPKPVRTATDENFFNAFTAELPPPSGVGNLSPVWLFTPAVLDFMEDASWERGI